MPFKRPHAEAAVWLPLSGRGSVDRVRRLCAIGSGVFSQCYSLQKIYYEGTIDEWRAVTKHISWRDGMPNCLIVCRDGEIRASES